jgi:hypothetical protein
MSNTCIYCKSQLSPESPIEVCHSCGHQVWGEKMFQAILDNMENARNAGDLHQGSVTESINEITQHPPNNKPAQESKNTPNGSYISSQTQGLPQNTDQDSMISTLPNESPDELEPTFSDETEYREPSL